MRIADSEIGRGLRVDDAFVRVDRSEIVGNISRGILAENGASVELRNSIVGGNGGDVPANPTMGIDAYDSTILVLYSTVAHNYDENRVDSIRCVKSTVTVRNSIVVGVDDEPSIDCPGIMITNSALDVAIEGNTVVGPAQQVWFVDTVAGNFHLSSTGMSSGAATFVDIAQWAMGDPTIDIDGDPRPSVDGMADYAGADVP